MFAAVQVSGRSVDKLRVHAGDEAVQLLRALARPLEGVRVLHLSISPFGTSVADLLHSTIPLLRDLGIRADWQVVTSDEEFSRVGRLLYAGLSGRRVDWTSEAEDGWRQYSICNARLFEGDYDVVVVHDPQSAGLLAELSESGRFADRSRWVWHCHLDLRRAQPGVWETLLPALRLYDAWVMQDDAFAPPGSPCCPRVVIAPAIDPTGARNMPLPRESVRQFLARYGLSPDRPLVVQVGPFDSSFDPMGTLEMYRRAKLERRDLQLLLVHPSSGASLDAWSRFERVARQVGPDPDAQVLVGQGDAGQVTVNAAQRAATAVVQRSVPAGFSLHVWEGSWKSRPVVVGNSGGLPRQVVDGVSGYLARDDDRFVEALLCLASDRERSAHFGAAGRRLVKERHLITRLLADELRLYGGLLAGARPAVGQEVLISA